MDADLVEAPLRLEDPDPVLLGLLLGSVLGLYPFQRPVHPELAARDVRKAVVAVVVDGEPSAEVAATVDSVDEEELAALARRWEGRTKGDLKRALRAALEGKRDVHGRATPEVRQAPPRQ